MDLNELTTQIESDAKTLIEYDGNTYGTCHKLAECAGKLIEDNAESLLRRGMEAILSVYTYSTDNKVKTAIENVLLYNVSTHIMLSSNRKCFLSSMPILFRKIMTDQIYHSGI